MGKSEKRSKSKRINILRQRYDEFLEEDRKRKERNEYILCRLDQIRNSSASTSRSRFFSRALPSITVDAPTQTRRYVSEEYQRPQTQVMKVIPNNTTIIRHGPEELLFQEISKKFILIPRTTSLSYINTNDTALSQTEIPVTTESNPKDDNDWRSKYNILDHLKNQEILKDNIPMIYKEDLLRDELIEKPEKDTSDNITKHKIIPKHRDLGERNVEKLLLSTDSEYYTVHEQNDLGVSLKDINENEPLNNVHENHGEENYVEDYGSEKNITSINYNINNLSINKDDDNMGSHLTQSSSKNLEEAINTNTPISNYNKESELQNYDQVLVQGHQDQNYAQEVLFPQSDDTVKEPLVQDQGSTQNFSLDETSHIYNEQNKGFDTVNGETNQAQKVVLQQQQQPHDLAGSYEGEQPNIPLDSEGADKLSQYDNSNYIYENQTVYEKSNNETLPGTDIQNYEPIESEAVAMATPGQDQDPYGPANEFDSNNTQYDQQAYTQQSSIQGLENSNANYTEAPEQLDQYANVTDQHQIYSYPTEESVQGTNIHDQTAAISDEKQVYSNQDPYPSEAASAQQPTAEPDMNLYDQQHYDQQNQELQQQEHPYEQIQPEYEQQILPAQEELIQEQNTYPETTSAYYPDPNNLPESAVQQQEGNVDQTEYQQEAVLEQPYYEHGAYNEQDNYSTQEAGYVQNPNVYPPETYDPSQQQYEGTEQYEQQQQFYQEPANYDQQQYYPQDQQLVVEQQIDYQQGEGNEQNMSTELQETTPSEIQPQLNTPSEIQQETVDNNITGPVDPHEVKESL